MNHYCPSLVFYNRALKSSSPVVKQQYLFRAQRGIEYTLGYMKEQYVTEA